MSRSIWRLSGAHWLRCAGAWTAIGTALAALVSTSAAETQRVSAKAEKPVQPIAGQRMADAGAAGHIVVNAIQSFDFNTADADRYGDAEHDITRH